MPRALPTVDVEVGPVLRAACDVLDLVHDALELIPEWHAAERAELKERLRTLGEVAANHLKSQS